MGTRKGVKASTKMNKNGNGDGEIPISTSSTSMEISQGQSQSADNKIRGENSNKKMKRGEASNSGVDVDARAGQTQESSVKETSMNNLHSESANANGVSSSSYWTRSRKEAQVPEIRELELTSKREKDEDGSSNSLGQSEADDEVVTEGPINDLPPEMLTKILKCVGTRSLLKCRLVNLDWLEISSRILTTRPDLVLNFKYYDIKRAPVHHHPFLKKENKRLQEFVQSMKKCSNFPYASFSFNVDDPSFFDDKNWIEFLSVFAPSNPKQNPNQNQKTKIKYLQFRWDSVSPKRLLLFTEKLSGLLVSKIPRLEELGLDLESSIEVQDNSKLFPLPKTPEAKTATVSASVPIQLPYLKVLVIDPCMFLYFPGITEDLLKAAVNLTTINKEGPHWDQEVFQFLHSLGKLHLLQKVDIQIDRAFLSSLRNYTQHQHSNYPLGCKMLELKLYPFARYINPTFYSDASNFLSNLLKSSKDTLEKLKMPSLGFLDELQFPKFTKLRTLKLKTCDTLNDVEKGQQLFPRGIRSRDIFPAVDDLSIITADWESAFPHEDSIPIFSSVSTLCFSDEELVGNVIAKLALMCPNLKHCVIQTDEGNPELFNFPRVGREIWTHLPQLESLEVDLDVNLPNHAFPALDSCFTGISIENCKRLSDLMEAEKTKSKSKSPVKLPESQELTTLTKREHPSILDMKNLKTLTVNPYSGKRKHQGKNFFTTKITWISEEFAFKLMPHLQFNGRRPSTSS